MRRHDTIEPARDRRTARICGAALALCLGACGGDPASGGRTGGTGPFAAAETCRDNETQPCTCGALPGRQVCRAGAFDACECSDPLDIAVGSAGTAGAPALDPLLGNLREDITFEWTRTEPDGLTCEPGHYEGSFAGLYYSRLNWPAPFPVTGVDIPGQPGLQFDMLPAEPGEVTLRVDGKFDGLADGVFPFRGDFLGELDCATGKFIGMMRNGEYSIGPDQLVVLENPVRFTFEGPVTADYDKITHSFINGTWDAFEAPFGGMPSVSLPRDPFRDGVGGSGVWSASWIGKPVDYKCPATDAAGLPLACQPGPFGLTKTFCLYPSLIPGARADGPTCQTDADCQRHFPREVVQCVDVNGDGVYVRCLKECSP